jgi:hypothetical protein
MDLRCRRGLRTDVTLLADAAAYWGLYVFGFLIHVTKLSKAPASICPAVSVYLECFGYRLRETATLEECTPSDRPELPAIGMRSDNQERHIESIFAPLSGQSSILCRI